jgi:hypothetical protein
MKGSKKSAKSTTAVDRAGFTDEYRAAMKYHALHHVYAHAPSRASTAVGATAPWMDKRRTKGY